MAITLNEIRTEVRANLKSSLIAQARIDFWANLALQELWRDIDPEYGKETATFTTAASTRAYRFECSVLKILSVVDQTNDLKLVQISESEVEAYDPDLNDSGTPSYYTLYGIDYVNNQPSAASVVTVVSSSAADTTQTVQIIGISSGVEAAETLTLNCAVNVVGTTSFTSLRRITKSATTTGRITATTNAGVVTNVIIPPRRILVEYQPIRLWPVPAGIYTIYVRYIRNPIPMRDASDIPDLPDMWHSVLLDLVMAQGHEFLYEFDPASRKRGMAAKSMQDLKANQGQKRDYSPVIGRRRFKSLSLGRLGPFYPID
mgnify:CR=1 FL=1